MMSKVFSFYRKEVEDAEALKFDKQKDDVNTGRPTDHSQNLKTGTSAQILTVQLGSKQLKIIRAMPKSEKPTPNVLSMEAHYSAKLYFKFI